LDRWTAISAKHWPYILLCFIDIAGSHFSAENSHPPLFQFPIHAKFGGGGVPRALIADRRATKCEACNTFEATNPAGPPHQKLGLLRLELGYSRLHSRMDGYDQKLPTTDGRTDGRTDNII